MNNNIENHKNCPMRHENGNCLPAGGFCTAVHECICNSLHNAYSHGFSDCHTIISSKLIKTQNNTQETKGETKL